MGRWDGWRFSSGKPTVAGLDEEKRKSMEGVLFMAMEFLILRTIARVCKERMSREAKICKGLVIFVLSQSRPKLRSG